MPGPNRDCPYACDAKDDPKRLRRILAWPIYFVAFVCQLLCAGLTILAAKIAGDPT
jgi:hypothetical protein